MKLLIAILIIAASLPVGAMDLHEKTFHVLNAVDMFQTINSAAKDPCYHEGNPLTRRLIGTNPSVEGVVLSSIAYSLAYHYGTKMIDRSRLPKWTKNYTFGIAIGFKTNTVVSNHNRGIRMYGDNHFECGL